MLFFALFTASGWLLIVRRDDSAPKILAIWIVVVFKLVPVVSARCSVLIFVLGCDIFVFLRAHPIFFFLGNFGKRKDLKGLEEAVFRRELMSSGLRFILVFFIDFPYFLAIGWMLLLIFREWLGREECILFMYWVVASEFMPSV